MDEQALNELLECSVCLERLDHTSKVLPCQHTFCRRCLDEIISTKRELRCPECRSLVHISVDQLPSNILLMRLLEGLKSKPGSVSGPRSPGRSFDSSGSPAGGRGHPQRQASQPAAKALFNYEAKEHGDLTFKKGDVITLRKQIDDNWYHGELNGQHGFFPATYVQVLVALPVTTPLCKALYDFGLEENEKDCLSFSKEETLTVIRRVDDNWVEGKKGDKIGIFPIAFVEMNDAAKCLINPKLCGTQSVNASTSTGGDCPVDPSASTANPALLPIHLPQQKRHSFTSPSPSHMSSLPNQSQNRHSLELSTVALPLPPAPPPPRPEAGTSSESFVPISPPPNLPQPPGPPVPAILPGGSEGREPPPVPPAVQTPVFVALYNYKPQKEDEVELKKGDYYTVTEKCQDGWFKGTCLKTGDSGVFPGNYVAVQRAPSAFRSVGGSVLNIRAKVPNSGLPSGPTSNTPGGEFQVPPRTSMSQTVTKNTSPQSSASVIKQTGPPLAPRASKSHSSSSSHGPVPAAALPSTPLSSKASSSSSLKSSSTERPAKSIALGTSAYGSRKTGASTSPWSSSLAAIHHSMSATTQLTPPNVVVGATGEVPSVPTHVSKEKKEKKDKEKLSLVKRLTTGKSKKPKSLSVDAESASASASPESAITHTRSGSYPTETGPVAAGDSVQHKKTGSFDLSSSQGGAAAKPNKPKPPVREKFRCIVPYPPQGEIELELKIGDVVYVHRKREDGWFKGTLQRSGKTGLFPGSFVEKVD